MKLSAGISFADTLKQAHTEKAGVAVLLRNGQSLAGGVGEVADHHVVISQLTGREFYDAVVRIEDISAIEVRVRER